VALAPKGAGAENDGPKNDRPENDGTKMMDLQLHVLENYYAALRWKIQGTHPNLFINS